jgi:hypothetical protein
VIVASSAKLEIGKIHTPADMTDDRGHFVGPQPLYVIREATEQEYLAGIPSKFRNLIRCSKGWYFYEVSTD